MPKPVRALLRIIQTLSCLGCSATYALGINGRARPNIHVPWYLVWQINVRVTTMDAELEFAIQPATNGKQLFDQVRQCTWQPK